MKSVHDLYHWQVRVDSCQASDRMTDSAGLY